MLHDDPTNATVLYLLGTACHVQGKLDEAVASYEQALKLKPDYSEVNNNLGVNSRDAIALGGSHLLLSASALVQAGLCGHVYELRDRAHGSGEARRGRQPCCARQSACGPTPPERTTISPTLCKSERTSKKVSPATSGQSPFKANHADAYNNMAKIFLVEGRADEAITAYRRAVAGQPDSPVTHSNLLFALNYDPRMTAAELAAEHRRWAEIHGRVPPLGPASGHDADRERRLRIGYLSAGLLQSSVHQLLRADLDAS